MSSASDATEWPAKARQDARSARRLLLDPPELADSAYHVHQAVEKAAKAILTFEGIRFPRSGGAGHDLSTLATLIPAGALRAHAQALSGLTPWATAFRYPAEDPLTAQPLPTRHVVELRLDEAEAFVEEVALHVVPVRPSVP